MDSMLRAFLGGRTHVAYETATWDTIELEIRYYLSSDLPPDHLVTSARAIVMASGHVLVVREPNGVAHILPGGRRKVGEPLEVTVRREILEETRWTIADPSLLAVSHFHITGVVPEGYPYPNPDFLQVVYLARPLEFHEEYAIEDEWVAESQMLPIDSLRGARLSKSQQLLLSHAVSRANARDVNI